MANTNNTNTTNETKKVPAIACTIAEDLDGITLSFANGKTLELVISSLSPNIRTYAAAHGLKQKLVDAAAISCSPETGRPATIEDKFEAVKTVYERLLTGQWNKPREGSGAVVGGLLFKALCRMYPAKTPDDLKQYLSTKSEADKAALRKNPRVAAIIEEIKAETAKTPDGTGDALLDELDEM